jgi:hypothetical protein
MSFRFLASAMVLLAAACSDDDEAGGAGGSGASGGMDGGGSGGTNASGGTSGSGGSGATGGASGSGGGAASGGTAGAAGGGGASGAAGTAGAGGDVGQPPNVAFVTSETFEPSTLGGLDGADAACRAAAAAAGLPGTFVAWLSDSSNDALTRLGTARAWVRTDGRPFVDSTADLVGLRHLYPLHIDENGQRYDDIVVATGTNQAGLRDAGSGAFCQDWTAAAASDGYVVGNPSSFGANWTGASVFLNPCTEEARLYCFQTDHSQALEPTLPPSRKAFVTKSSIGTTGLAGFDQHCADEAQAGSITGTFKALVATNGASAISRFDTTGDPWGRLDGALLTDTAAELGTTTRLLAPIIDFSDRTFVWDSPGGELVYTGAATPLAAGIAAETCGGNWTSIGGMHVFGFAGLATPQWWSDLTLPSPAGCNNHKHLYCLEE